MRAQATATVTATSSRARFSSESSSSLLLRFPLLLLLSLLNGSSSSPALRQRRTTEEETPGELGPNEPAEATRDIDFLYNSSGNAAGPGEDGDGGNIVPILCSDNLREFTATTEMILSGRSDLLSLVERKVLKGEFMNIYNTLTTTKCDLYHRKLNVISFLKQENQEGEVYTFEDMMSMNVTLQQDEEQLIQDWFNPVNRRTRRQLQENLNGTTTLTLAPTPAPTASLPPVNETTASSSSTITSTSALTRNRQVAVTYQIVGTCRNCPVSTTGSFQLYDDAFRRALSESGIQIRTKHVQIRDLIGKEDQEYVDDKRDCVCTEGVPPTPQAPGVRECVDLMNERLPLVQEGTGILQDLKLEDLLELDPVEPPPPPQEEQAEAGEDTTNTSSGGEEDEEDDGDGDGYWEAMNDVMTSVSRNENNLDLNVWGRKTRRRLQRHSQAQQQKGRQQLRGGSTSTS